MLPRARRTLRLSHLDQRKRLLCSSPVRLSRSGERHTASGRESTVKGDIDLHGFLGLDDNVRRGYKNIKITFRIKANVPDEQLEELCQLGPTYSPVFDSLTNGVPVEVSLEK
jgi:OsmC-like protein